MTPWTTSQTSTGWNPSALAGYGRGTPASRVLYGQASNTNDNTLTLKQTISIAEGTVIDVGCWFKPYRDGDSTSLPFSVTLRFDQTVAYTFKPTTAQKSIWTSISNPASSRITVTGAGPHIFSLEVRNKGVSGSIFMVDDFTISAVSGPNAAPICKT